MKKLAVILMTALITCLLVTGISAFYTPVTVAKLTTPPTLDGVIEPGEYGEPVRSLKSLGEIAPYAWCKIENDWPEYQDVYKNVLKDTSLMPSAIDLYMNWDDEFFYLAVQIKVETRCAPNYEDIWHKDCIYFNTMDDPYYWAQNSFNTGDGYHTVIFTVHDDGDLIYEIATYANYDINSTSNDRKWAGVRDEAAKTTTYEMAFYWDELIAKAVTHQMTVGDMFGINLSISPTNYDGDPYNIIDIVLAGVGEKGEQYNWAVTLGDVGAAGVSETPAETPAETEPEAPAETPADVSRPSSWALKEVNAAISSGLVPKELRKNYQSGISREDLSKMLGILIDRVYAGAAASADAAFTDTTDAAVLKAANLGIINGYKQDDGTFMFKPANTLKRSEMSAIINRVAKLCGEETTGFDAEVKFEDTASHWCNGELGYPVHMGIVKGTSDTTFSPENTLTVEQTVMMIYRTYTALQKAPAQAREKYKSYRPGNWADNEPGTYNGGVDGIDFVLNVESGKDIEIIQISDTQIITQDNARNEMRYNDLASKFEPGGYEENLDKYIRAILENSSPDLIVLNGDNVYGETDDSGEGLRYLIGLMDSYGIPWACTFGNHDNESAMGVLWQCEQFANSEFGLFCRGHVSGNSNYNIVIRQDGKIKYTVYLLDSHGCKVLDRGAGILEDNPDFDIAAISDGIYDDQIEWFEKSNRAIQKLAGRTTVPNIEFQHIPVRAVFAAVQEKYAPEEGAKSVRCNQDGDFGFLTDGVGSEPGIDREFVLTDACKANGTLGMFFGHSHTNDASVVWNGMRYTFGSKSSTYDMSNKSMIGGTRITLSSGTAELKVEHLKYNKIAEK